MKFERHEDDSGFLSDDFGNVVELSDEQINAMSDMNGTERLAYIIENLRDPLRKTAEKEGGMKKTRNPQLGKDPLEILDQWINKKGIAKTLGKIRFDDEEDDEDEEDEAEETDEDGEDDER